jgi:hypothetical protein
MNKLCKEVIKQHIEGGDRHPKPSPAHHHEASVVKPGPSASAKSVRHHWVPQFRPNSLTDSLDRVTELVSKREENSPTYEEPCRTEVGEPLSLPDTVHLKPNESRRFTIEEFLSAPDPTTRYPADSSFSNAVSAHAKPHTPIVTLPPPTYAEREGALAVCRALASKGLKAATPALCDATGVEETQSMNPLSSTILARWKFAFHSPSPEGRKGLDDFLAIGHANPCWCSAHGKPLPAPCTVGDTMETSPALSPQRTGWVRMDIGAALTMLLEPDSQCHRSNTASEISTSSFDNVHDALHLSPDHRDGWTLIQHNSPTHQTHIVSSLEPKLYIHLPSSPSTPPASGAESTLFDLYGEDASPSPWKSSPVLSLNSSVLPSPAIKCLPLEEAEFEDWEDWESNSDMVTASAAEWPTLQQATKMTPMKREQKQKGRSGSFHLRS